jgi:Ca2+-binding EF-hand superfamily protein
MYDVDGNGVIDQDEMTKIVQAIYDMLGAGAVKPTDTAEERAKNIFNRFVSTSGTAERLCRTL